MPSRADTPTDQDTTPPVPGTALVPLQPASPALPPPIPPPDGLTPAMAAFAEAYVSSASGCAAQAAREAGYPESHARQSGYRLLRHEGVQAYIGRLVTAAVSSTAPQALRTMLALATGARSEFVRQAAAADLLDRAGHKPAASGAIGGKAGGGSVTITIDLG